MDFGAVILLVLLLAGSATSSAVETAFLVLNRMDVERIAKRHLVHGAYLKKLKSHPRNFIIMILILNNLLNITLSVIVAILTERNFGNSYLGLATGLLTFVVVAFREI